MAIQVNQALLQMQTHGIIETQQLILASVEVVYEIMGLKVTTHFLQATH